MAGATPSDYVREQARSYSSVSGLSIVRVDRPVGASLLAIRCYVEPA